MNRWHGHDDELVENLDAARSDFTRAVDAGNTDISNIVVGEAVGLIHSVEDAGDVVRNMTAQAEAILTSRSLARQ